MSRTLYLNTTMKSLKALSESNIHHIVGVSFVILIILCFSISVDGVAPTKYFLILNTSTHRTTNSQCKSELSQTTLFLAP